MAKLPLQHTDPTLDAIDRIMEDMAAQERPRSYLGMSQIGEECARKSWYRFRFARQERFDAATLKRFEDGHRTEALVIARMKLLPELTLVDVEPETGKQIGFVDCDGHFRGHADGSIMGILQAPKALHVFEVKCVSEKKLSELMKAIHTCGEKGALQKWNPTYYGQAMLYCDYLGATRHYLVCATAGGREWIGVRTNEDKVCTMRLKAKANRVISSNEPLEKISEKSDYFECRYCAFSGICHEAEMPDRSCRTCLHSTPIADGQWHCERWGCTLTNEQQLMGCQAHKYLPPLVPGEVLEAQAAYVKYKMPDGSIWMDSEAV